jgi:hypothetical protein
MNYAAFKSYLATFLWKDNDSVLIANLDNLIKMAHAELGRKLDIQAREVSITIAPTSEDYVLPADFGQMISLTDNGHRVGLMGVASKAVIMELRKTTQSRGVARSYYVQKGDTPTLFLVGNFSVSEPGSFDLTYRTAIPDFAVTDESWLADDYLDLYTYTVLSHSATFLREDERLETWLNLKMDALMSALDEDKRHVRFGGSPLEMRPHHHVPRTRR